MAPAPNTHSLSIISNPTRAVHLSQLVNIHGHITTRSPQVTLGFTLGVVHSMGLDKCIMICIHHYSIIQNSFTALKILCAQLIYPCPPSPKSLATTNISTISRVYPFLECRIVGIIQHVAFSDWLISLSNMHVNFLPFFSWLGNSFLFFLINF